MKTTISVYAGTFYKYNSGSLFGAWFDLSDFDSKEDFYAHLRRLHKDEADPEFMFQDYEAPKGFENFISESWIDDIIFEIIHHKESPLHWDGDDWLNNYNNSCGSDDCIFDFSDPEDFFEMMYSGKPFDAVRASLYGNINLNDDFIKFNGYGNLETLSDPGDYIDKEEVLTYWIENNL